MPIAEIILRIRRDYHYNQRELAGRLGINQALISCWERGVRQPNRLHRALLQKHFGAYFDGNAGN